MQSVAGYRLSRREQELLKMPGVSWLTYLSDDSRLCNRMEGLLRARNIDYVYPYSYEPFRLLLARCSPKQLTHIERVALSRLQPAPTHPASIESLALARF